MNMSCSPSRAGKANRIGLLEVGLGLASLGIVVYLVRCGIFSPASLEVRAPRPEDDRRDARYFGFLSSSMRPRNLAVVRGTFTFDTSLHARLYLVRSGVKQEGDGITVGRSRNRFGESSRITLHIRLALGEEDTPKGRRINLGSYGHTSGTAAPGDMICPLEAKFTRLLEGPLARGAEQIIYVEGDRECSVDRQMSIDEFARTNAGNHLVVMAQMN